MSKESPAYLGISREEISALNDIIFKKKTGSSAILEKKRDYGGKSELDTNKKQKVDFVNGTVVSSTSKTETSTSSASGNSIPIPYNVTALWKAVSSSLRSKGQEVSTLADLLKRIETVLEDKLESRDAKIGCLEILSNLINEKSDEALKLSVEAFWNATQNENFVEAKYYKEKAVRSAFPRLVDLLEHKDATIVNSALGSIGNISCGDEVTSDLISLHLLPRLSSVIARFDEKDILCAAFWTLSNLTGENESVSKLVLEDRKLLKQLTDTVQATEKDYKVRKEAIWAFTNTIRYLTSFKAFQENAYLLRAMVSSLSVHIPNKKSIVPLTHNVLKAWNNLRNLSTNNNGNEFTLSALENDDLTTQLENISSDTTTYAVVQSDLDSLLSWFEEGY